MISRTVTLSALEPKIFVWAHIINCPSISSFHILLCPPPMVQSFLRKSQFSNDNIRFQIWNCKYTPKEINSTFESVKFGFSVINYPPRQKGLIFPLPSGEMQIIISSSTLNSTLKFFTCEMCHVVSGPLDSSLSMEPKVVWHGISIAVDSSHIHSLRLIRSASLSLSVFPFIDPRQSKLPSITSRQTKIFECFSRLSTSTTTEWNDTKS